jgi:hypothetical protein
MGGKGTTTTGDTIIKFAPYIEAMHRDYVAALLSEEFSALNSNPYATYVNLEIDAAFFGAGYVLSSFPALYDMYGKFMAGFDIDTLFNEVYEDTINGTLVDAAIADEAEQLSDDLENETLPRYELGMRDINAVMSSTFVVGRAMLETARTKALSKFSSSLRTSLLPIATERWTRHLEWNRVTVDMYAQIMKLYLAAKHDVTDLNTEHQRMKALWPFTVLEFERAAIATLNQPQQTTSTQTVKSNGGVLGGILQGVAGVAGLLSPMP